MEWKLFCEQPAPVDKISHSTNCSYTIVNISRYPSPRHALTRVERWSWNCMQTQQTPGKGVDRLTCRKRGRFTQPLIKNICCPIRSFGESTHGLLYWIKTKATSHISARSYIFGILLKPLRYIQNWFHVYHRNLKVHATLRRHSRKTFSDVWPSVASAAQIKG